jgi:dTDP-4-dehydrorhamnose 3,5-epimerase
MDGDRMKRLEVADTPIHGLRRVTSLPLGDHRGYLARVFCADELAEAGWGASVAQINLTHTRQAGTVRGLHFQHPPHAELKLVRCLRGEVWDVVVDLRHDSPTFLRWHAEKLSADNLAALLIPQGCAHGFQALVDGVDMLYLHSAAYAPSHEDGLRATDPRLGIQWPHPITEMSSRDAGFALLTPSFAGIRTP